MESTRRAVIDIGTVSTRLFVAQCADGSIEELEKLATITQLGAGLSQTGKMSRESLDATAAAIDSYIDIMSSHGVVPSERKGNVVAIATSASRDAENSHELETILADRAIPLHIISGDLEAQLSFAGASNSAVADSVMVVDIGGGSTEVIIGAPYRECLNGEGLTFKSFDIGCRRVTDLFLHEDPPTAESIRETIEWARSQFEAFFEKADRIPSQMIGVAGTITTMIAISKKLAVYDSSKVHNQVITRDVAESLLNDLSSMPLDERRQVVGLQPQRAGVIVGGIAIFIALLDACGLEECTVSESDNLLGTMLVWPF